MCDVDFGHGFWTLLAALVAGEWWLLQKRAILRHALYGCSAIPLSVEPVRSPAGLCWPARLLLGHDEMEELGRVDEVVVAIVAGFELDQFDGPVKAVSPDGYSSVTGERASRPTSVYS